ncbi:hypothetical protein PUNSTDRAFT_146729 [Punctularia strigosozonata HHB-11173 SS5]|uniref:DUF7605 domain-containing protein n=1 Tax=Punctularia strigosozonata (strain HHB-11173) TaxID=741275 RepID=R7S0P0_PUNST|nr:uncharacterized protein PUNSTDRAFT_146729 [Punctularia strigosozonata HHB-11173 SS5]EIN03960.1 hypothetical protein PUNSTDRAFT_146729 [Punctularia strigosozonata HHB-11173 SS5]
MVPKTPAWVLKCGLELLHDLFGMMQCWSVHEDRLKQLTPRQLVQDQAPNYDGRGLWNNGGRKKFPIECYTRRHVLYRAGYALPLTSNPRSEQILPAVSSGKAGTGVPIQVEYHEDSNIFAEVCFITRDEWLKEISDFLVNAEDDDGVRNVARIVRGVNKIDGAVITFEKLQAAYPGLKPQDLDRISAEDVVAKGPHLDECFGRTKIFIGDASAVSQQLRIFVTQNGARSRARGGNFWPIVSSVNIKIKSPVLESGAVFVDLPGSEDVNTARASVAESYKNNADAFLIVSAATRAEDDERAHRLFKSLLLGEFHALSFGHSLIFVVEGRMRDNIAFVCTKTDENVDGYADDIADDEKLEEQQVAIFEARDLLQKAQERLALLRSQQDEDACALQDGDQVSLHTRFSDPNGSRKRRGVNDTSCSTSNAARQKRQRVRMLAPEFRSNMLPSSVSEWDDLFGMEVDTPSHNSPVSELQKAVDVRDTIATELARKEADLRLYLARHRSQSIREGVRSKLTDMIQEWTWGGECDAPYSTLVGRGQPEFFPCSAQEYLRLSGKSQRSGAGGVFTRLGETGILSLRKWCSDVSTRTHRSASGRFLEELRSYIEDVRSFMDNTLAGRAGHRARLQTWGTLIRKHLLPRFEELVKDEVSELQAAFRDRIEEFCVYAAERADKEVVRVLDRLYSKPWPTVRATLRAKGEHRTNLNAEFVAPFTDDIMVAWRAMFSMVIFDDVEEKVEEIVKEMLASIERSDNMQLTDSATKAVFDARRESCIKIVHKHLKFARSDFQQFMCYTQINVSQSLASNIKYQLEEGYRAAMRHTGKGSVNLQKDEFRRFVLSDDLHLFKGLQTYIQAALDRAATEAGFKLSRQLDNLTGKLVNDISLLWEAPTENYRRDKLKVYDLISGVKRLEVPLTSAHPRLGA